MYILNSKWYIILFCNHLILGVTWRATIKRFDSILRHASLKLSRYTLFHDIEALHKCLVNKFGLFSSFSVLLTLAEMKIISGL